LMPRNQRSKHEEQPRLALGQTCERWQQIRPIVFLLALHDCRRVRPRRRQVDAVTRTPDFNEPLRAAAHRADLLSNRRTGSFALSLTAQWADHLRKLAHRRATVVAVLSSNDDLVTWCLQNEPSADSRRLMVDWTARWLTFREWDQLRLAGSAIYGLDRKPAEGRRNEEQILPFLLPCPLLPKTSAEIGRIAQGWAPVLPLHLAEGNWSGK
jgi:hypothetical protein